MDQNIENCAHRELNELDALVEKEMNIPAAILTECGSSFFMLDLISNHGDAPPIVEFESENAMKSVYVERTEQLFASVPHVPKASVMLVCNAYLLLDIVFRDDSSSTSESVIELLLAAALMRGVALGLLRQSASPDEAMQIARTTLAKIGATARHSTSRVNKQKVFKWCDANMCDFSSMDEAAMDIAGTFIPEKFRAVRDWMTEWKKLRSASKP